MFLFFAIKIHINFRSIQFVLFRREKLILEHFALIQKVVLYFFYKKSFIILGYKPADEPPSEYQSIPLNKIEDFGVHCKQYYSLDVSYFKSALDTKILEALWNTYWVNTLSSNPLVTNSTYITSQISDLGAKLEQVELILSVYLGFRLGSDREHTFLL